MSDRASLVHYYAACDYHQGAGTNLICDRVYNREDRAGTSQQPRGPRFARSALAIPPS